MITLWFPSDGFVYKTWIPTAGWGALYSRMLAVPISHTCQAGEGPWDISGLISIYFPRLFHQSLE